MWLRRRVVVYTTAHRHRNLDSTCNMNYRIPTFSRYRLASSVKMHPPASIVYLVRYSAIDLFTQLVCLTTAWLLYTLCSPISQHDIPYYDGVWLSQWGLKHSKAFRNEYLSTPVCGMIAFLVPASIIAAVSFSDTRSFSDIHASVSLSILSPLTTLLISRSKWAWVMPYRRLHFL